MRWLGGDLGGGYFPGVAPALRWDTPAAVGFALLGTASALVGGWMPARRAEALSPAMALKGLGDAGAHALPAWPGLALLGLGSALAFLPPIAGLPLAAYLSVAALLFGGVALVPVAVQALLALLPTTQDPLRLLAVQRARFQRHTASAAVAGVVASLALSVALTVMVTSFRGGVADWLDKVLPADLYARSAGNSATSELSWLDPAFIDAVAALPGVERVQGSRVRSLQLAPGRPPVTLIARPLPQAAQALPLIEAPLPAAPGETGVYLSEAAALLYGLQPGQTLQLPLRGAAGEGELPVRVLGIWRDYARQFGAIAIDLDTYRQLTGDQRINDLALWFTPDANTSQVQQRLRELGSDTGLLEFAATPELRALSLAIFDRSFAVTYYLQAVAIAIGLVGVAASMSAQVLARRKEFGLLSHLGLTRAPGHRRGRRRRRCLAGRRHADRPGAGAGGERGAGARRQPAEFPLDDAVAAALGPAAGAVRRRAAGRRRHGRLQRARRGLTQRAAVGEGGLVTRRRALLRALALAGAWPLRLSAADDEAVHRGRVLLFPRDHGAHLGAAIEWWYVTGDVRTDDGLRLGFQITFFRSRTGLAEKLDSRFAPRHLLFAHAALTELKAARHLHAQRIARWSGDPSARLARASLQDTDLRLGGWSLQRRDADGLSLYDTTFSVTPDVRLALQLRATQPLLLQGDGGFSRKGPDEAQASQYLSEPQLAVTGTLQRAGRAQAVQGRAWLDHEWSDQLLHADAVGWDWIGMNLDDGGALTAFQLRRADGSSAVGGGQFPRCRRRAAGLCCRRGELQRRAGFGPAPARARAIRCSGRSTRPPGASRCVRCWTRRNSTAAPAPARSIGKA